MKEVSYEEGRALALTHICSECQAGLLVAWGGGFGIEGYVLRCGRDAQHQGFVKHGNPTRRRLEKMGLNQEEVDNEMETGITVRGDRLAKYRGVTGLSKEMATEVVKTLWPDAPTVEVVKAALTCQQYGLNPLKKHLVLVKFWNKKLNRYDWAQIWGIGATRLVASRSRRYSYVDGPRLMTAQEQEGIFGEVDPNNLVAITILQDEHGNRAPGYGRFPKTEDPHGMDKGNTRANMAMIRSERNAIERLIPGEMPHGEVMAEEYMEEPSKVIDVDPTTGEILDGAEEPPQNQGSTPPQTGSIPPEAGSTPPQTGGAPAVQAQADPPQGKVMTPTEFWTKARELGYDDATKTELALGKTVPRWIRDGGTYRTALIALQAAKAHEGEGPKEAQ